MDFDACIKLHMNPSPGELSYVGGQGPERVVVGMWAFHPQRCPSCILTLLLNLVSSFPLGYVEVRLKPFISKNWGVIQLCNACNHHCYLRVLIGGLAVENQGPFT